MSFEALPTRWKPKVKSSKAKNSGSCRCSFCRPAGPSRGVAKNALNTTLEREYRFPVGRRARPNASAIVNWFFEDEEEVEEHEHGKEQIEDKNEIWGSESLAKALGAEDYEGVLREHIEVENALMLARAKGIREATVAAPLMSGEQSNAAAVTEDWEVVSEVGIDLEDWEHVVVE